MANPATGIRDLGGLRDVGTMEAYLWFCENFMECVITSHEWKMKSRKQKMSEYLTPTLEAFAILMYSNSYEVWNQRWKSQASTSSNSSREGDDMSTLSGASSKASFKYTGDSKGCQKYRGWNREGMDFYNQLLDLVEFQRQRAGCSFERVLLTALATKPRYRGAAEREIDPPKARNHLDHLMEIVGV